MSTSDTPGRHTNSKPNKFKFRSRIEKFAAAQHGNDTTHAIVFDKTKLLVKEVYKEANEISTIHIVPVQLFCRRKPNFQKVYPK